MAVSFASSRALRGKPTADWKSSTPRRVEGLESNRLEALKTDRAGQYSIRINMQWRICFEWPRGAAGPSNVDIVDYH
jgi:plasmid maintenance system killer protein